MARWEPNCRITRNFAFGDKQYKKGKEYYLGGEVKEFAALNRCAVFIKEEAPEAVENAVTEGADV